MEKITVGKIRLMQTLLTNRDKHQAAYDEAVVAYRVRAIEEMERNLLAAQRGDEVVLYVRIPVPEIHTDDYNRAIDMLKWETSDTVSLSEHDFAELVQNEWGWARSFATNTVSYAARSH